MRVENFLLKIDYSLLFLINSKKKIYVINNN